MSFFSVFFRRPIHKHPSEFLWKWMEVQVKNQSENFKMRRVVLCLVLCSLVVLIKSALSHQSSSGLENVQSINKENFRLAKFNSLLWAPSDITVTFRKNVSNQTELSEGRAHQTKPVHNQQLSTNLNSDTKKSRSIESFERKHSKHSGN